MTFLKDTAKQRIFKTAPSSAIVRKLSVSSSPLVTKNRVVSRNGTELFAAFDNIVRCSAIGKHTNYKILDVNVDYVIESLEMNDSGDLLALVGASKVVVVSLPAPGFLDRNDEAMIYVKSFIVGPSFPGRTRVLKVLWNLVAKYDANLVILTDDGVVRAYDLSVSGLKPATTYDLREHGLENAVSMTFGGSQSSFGRLILYVVSSDGSLYSLYPFLPSEISVSRDFVDSLFNDTAILVQDLKALGNDSGLKRNALNQLHFVSSLWDQFSGSSGSLPTEDVRKTLVLDPLFVLQTPKQATEVKLQGPYQIVPHHGLKSKICDIVSIPAGNAEILVMVLESAEFAILLQDRDPIMQWDEELDPDYMRPSRGFGYVDTSFTYDDQKDIDLFTTLSLLSGDRVAEHATGVFCDSSLHYQFVIAHELGCVKVDFSDWGEILSTSIRDGTPDEFAKLLDKHLDTDIVEILTESAEKEQIEGICLLTDPLNDDMYILTLTDKRADITEVENHRIGVKQKTIEAAAEDTSIEAITGDGSLLSHPSEASTLLKMTGTAVQVSGVDMYSKISANERSLSDLNAVSQETIKQIIGYHKVGLSLNLRIKLQQRELQQQVSNTEKILEMVNKRKTNVTDYDSSITALTQRQDKIGERADKLIRRLNENKLELPLSNEERDWFKEINSLNQNINNKGNRNGLLNKMESLKKQLEYIKTQLASNEFKEEPVPVSYGIENIKKYLDREKKVVERTRELLKGGDSGIVEVGDGLEKVSLH